MCASSILKAQTIVYSEPDRDDARNLNFAVVGKIGDHILVIKNVRSDYAISVYDDDMKLIDKVKLTFLPDRVLNADVLTYKSYFYLFYQYQKRNTVYCMGAKFNGDGKLMSDPVEMDTTGVGMLNNNKIYTLINSEDKQKIGIFKINSRYSDNYAVTTVLFDADLNKIKKSVMHINMPDRSDFLNDFSLANDGTIVFARMSGTAQSDNINRVTLIKKPAVNDTAAFADITIPQIFLDDIRLKIDNSNGKYLITSFFANNRRGNVDGLFCSIWDANQWREIYSTKNPFSNEFRSSAKSEGSMKSAFNDFFLQSIVMRKDGGFVVVAESAYTSTRGGGYANRWDYLYGNPNWGNTEAYMYNSPYAGGYYPWGRPGFNNFQVTRFFADNIAVISFDSTSKLEWASVVPKSQYDDNSDNFIGYGTLNAGSEVHFLFNELDRRTLILNDQSITGDGQVHRNPTLHNLDRGYDFMPRYAKQVGAHQLIVPCEYRNYVCFAKIDL
jgi:hypothetical protein